MWPVGGIAETSLRVTDPAGVPVDPQTVTCVATRPDGTTVACAVTRVDVGRYVAQASATLPGRWLFVWSGTGPNTGGLPYAEPVDVWPADPRMLIPLAEARAALNLPASVHVSDDELRLHCCAATVIAEDLCGPLLADTRTITLSGRGREGLLLPELATGIVSVVADDRIVDQAAYWLDPGAGILWHQSGVWAEGLGNITITCRVGAPVVSPHVIVAGRELVAHLYQTSQQGKRPQFGGAAADMSLTPAGYAIPRRVAELLAPTHNKPAAFA